MIENRRVIGGARRAAAASRISRGSLLGATLATAVTAIAATALACTGAGQAPRCTAGASAACSCTGGSQGAQRCNAGGAYEPCVCEPAAETAVESPGDQLSPSRQESTCEGVATRMVTLARPRLGWRPSWQDKVTNAALKASRPDVERALVQQCRAEGWSAETLRCVARAESADEADRCDRLLAEAVSYDATCEGAADHILELARQELEQKTGEEKELALSMLKSMSGEMKEAFIKQCKTEKWSQEALECIVAAESERDMDRCKELTEK